MPEYKDVDKNDMPKYLSVIEEWCLTASTISLLQHYLKLLLQCMSIVCVIHTFI